MSDRPKLTDVAMKTLARMRMALGQEPLEEADLERQAVVLVLSLYSEGWSLRRVPEYGEDGP